MKKLILILAILLVIMSLIIGGCGGTSETTTTTNPTTSSTTTTTTPTTTTTTPTTTTPPTTTPTETPSPTPTTTETPTETPTPTPLRSVVTTDDTNDLFDANGNPTTGEPYLDIIKAEIDSYETCYIARITVNGDLPTQTPDPSIFIEWDLIADIDMNANTGWPWPFVSNDIGPDFLFRVSLLDAEYHGQVYDIADNDWSSIEFDIKGNVVEIIIPKAPEQSDTGYYVFAVRKYGNRGASNALLVADKAPNTGHAEWVSEGSSSLEIIKGERRLES